MLKRNLLTTLSFLLIHFWLFPQSKLITSLETKLKAAKTDSARVDLLNQLSELNKNRDLKMSLEQANEALSIAKAINYKRGIATAMFMKAVYAYNSNESNTLSLSESTLEYSKQINYHSLTQRIYQLLSYIYFDRANTVKAREMNELSMQYAISSEDKHALSRAYFSYGNFYSDTYQYAKGVDMYLKSIRELQLIGDTASPEYSKVITNLARVYKTQGLTDDAIKIYNQSLIIDELSGDKRGQSIIYNNLAIIYLEKRNFDLALETHLKSLKLKEEIGDKDGMTYSYTGIGTVYEELNQFDKALEMHEKSLAISREINDEERMSWAYANIGNVNFKRKNYSEAIKYLELALRLGNKYNQKNLTSELNIILSDLYKETGDYKKAYTYYIDHRSELDSVKGEQQKQQILETRMLRELEEKEKEITTLNKIQKLTEAQRESEQSRQATLRNSLIGALLVALLITYLIYNRYSVKHKLSEKLQVVNKEVTEKNSIIEAQNEKIIDSITYAQYIQNSLLTDEVEIKKQLPNSFILYKPKDIVSGDFYWFSLVNDKIVFAAVDCTGHGVPGAFMSMIGNTLLNQIVNEKKITSPAEILKQLDKEVNISLSKGKKFNRAQDGMDISLCTIDKMQMQLTFAGARSHLYLLKNEKIETVKGASHSIGSSLRPDKTIEKNFTDHTIPLTHDTCIYLFTDGYMDQLGGTDTIKLGLEKFKQLLINNYRLAFDIQKKELENAHLEWKAENPQIDDILVVGFRV